MSARESGVENSGKHRTFEIHAVRLTVMLNLKRFVVQKWYGPPLSLCRVFGGVGRDSFAVGTRGCGVPNLFFAMGGPYFCDLAEKKHRPI